MKEFKNNKINSFWFSPLILLLMFLFVVFFTYKIFDLVKKQKETVKNKNLVLNEIKELSEREKILLENIDKLKTQKGTEQEIMSKYQVVKNGEKMVVIVDENDQNKTGEEREEKNNFWSWLRDFFK